MQELVAHNGVHFFMGLCFDINASIEERGMSAAGKA